MSKIEELKEVTAKKKELLAKQKELKQELDATKEERNKARTEIAECKRKIKESKSLLLKECSNIHSSFSTWDSDHIGSLTDRIKEASDSVVFHMDRLSLLVSKAGE